MKIDTDLLVDGLHALCVARSQGAQQLEATANLVLTKSLEALGEYGTVSPLDFSLLASLHGELRSKVLPKKAVLLGVRVLDARPDIKDDLPADHFLKLGSLFSTVVRDALKNRVVTDAIAHTFSEVFQSSFAKLSMDHQRPYLEASDVISWVGRGLLPTRHAPRKVLKGFMGTANGLRYGAELAQNQALMAMITSTMSRRLSRIDPNDCLVDGNSSADLDQLILKLRSWSDAGAKLKMQPLDTLMISQILEAMALVISTEQGTPRAAAMQDALPGVVGLVVRKTGKITALTTDYAVRSDQHPMAEDGDELTSLQRYLVEAMGATMALELPEACNKSLATFRMHLLLHAAAITPTLRENNPKYDGQAFIKELIKLAEPTLRTSQSLSRLSEEGRSVVAMAVEDQTLRMQLAEKYLSVRRDMFIKDIGL